MKGIIWKGTSKDDLKSFPRSVVERLGYQLFRIQCGIDPLDWKPMKSIGSGVREIRVKDSKGAFRVIYLASRPEGLYVLHCFAKKSEKTELQDLRIAKDRLKSIGNR